MKTEKHDTDHLLEQNTAEQLAGVDWIGLNPTISSRLDEAERCKKVPVVRSSVFRIAAGLVAAAAVILIVMIIRTDRAPEFQLDNGRLAAVEFIEAKGLALVEIGHAAARSKVMIDVGPDRNKLVRCDIVMIDVNGNSKEKTNRATWIIISRPEPVYADNSASRDSTDMISLF